MKKLRIYYWLVIAFIKRHRIRVIIGLTAFTILVLIPFYLTKRFTNPIARLTGGYIGKAEVYEGEVGNLKIINPLYASSNGEKEISKLVFRGLTKTNAAGEVIPDIAEKIEAKSDKEFIFYLH